MKRLNITVLLLLSLIALVGCGDDEDNYLKLNEKDFVSPVLQVQIKDGLVASQTNQADLAGTWQWTAAAFGVKSEISYQLIVDVNKDMSTAQDVHLYSVSDESVEFTVQTINDAVQAFLPVGAKGDEMVETTFYLMAKAYLGTAGVLSPVFSEPVEIKFTPFPISKTKGILYAVGDGLVGWDNNTGAIGGHLQVLFADDSKASNLKYTYTGYFKAGGGLKFPKVAGDWNTAYAYKGGALSPDNDGDNFPGPTEAGVYTLSVDLIDLSASLVKYEGEVKAYEKVGVVGTAVGSWDDDKFLTQVSAVRHVWIGKDIELATGKLKFRSGGNWDGKNWGGIKEEKGETQQLPFGVPGSEDITIDIAGSYFIAINTLTGQYVIVPMADLPVKK